MTKWTEDTAPPGRWRGGKAAKGINKIGHDARSIRGSRKRLALREAKRAVLLPQRPISTSECRCGHVVVGLSTRDAIRAKKAHERAGRHRSA